MWLIITTTAKVMLKFEILTSEYSQLMVLGPCVWYRKCGYKYITPLLWCFVQSTKACDCCWALFPVYKDNSGLGITSYLIRFLDKSHVIYMSRITSRHQICLICMQKKLGFPYSWPRMLLYIALNNIHGDRTEKSYFNIV